MASSPQVALITGGASGMGYGMAERLVFLGWNVSIVDFNETAGQVASERLGPQTIYIKGNVAKYADQAAAFVATFRKWGHIDLVWGNAGIGDRINFVAPVAEDPSTGAPSQPDTLVVDVCLYGVLWTSYLALHFFRKNESRSGKLVMTSSMAGLYPSGSIPLYSAAKHGVVGLTRSLAQQLQQNKENITVNCLCPGLVPTALPAQALINAFPEERLTPISTIVKAVEAFLDDNAVTGKVAECSGGNVYYRPAYEFVDDNAAYLVGGGFVKDVDLDPSVLANDCIEKGKKLDAML